MESVAPSVVPSVEPLINGQLATSPSTIASSQTPSPTISIICAIHDSSPDSILKNIAAQTLLPTEVCVGMSGTCPQWSPPKGLSVVYSDVFPGEPDFGYRKHNEFAKRSSSDWLAFMSQDDSYHPKYLELMLKWAVDFGTDIVWCRWNDRPYCQWQPCDSTLGNFIVKREVFLDLGGFPTPPEKGTLKSPAYPGTTFILDNNQGFRDAMFIQKSIEVGISVVNCPYMLYYHNVPFEPDQKVTSWGNPAPPNGSYARLVSSTGQQFKEQR